ncbi:MAG: domain containing protein [Streptosporangiaceae bacterium]|nr:domain containing protein [Streptosporangiaceae bacterium]
MSDHVEIEVKYDAEPDFGLPDLGNVPGVHSVGDPQTQVLVARYFDTADLRLASRGITLRRRRGGADAGWHLKIPAGTDTKKELRAPLGRAEVVPARLAALVAAHTRGEPLRPVATLETRRTVLRLLGEDGTELAEVADDAVTGRPADRGTGAEEGPSVRSWREIEVELAGGSPELLDAVGERLRGAGARKAESASKLGRLLGPAAAPGPVRRADARPSGTAGTEVLAYVREQVEALMSYDPKVRLAENDAVHKMRVAVRRLRSVLKTYRKVLDRERTDALRPELKWLADELGRVRDLEVLRERFTGRVEALPAGLAEHRGWLDDLGRQEQAAYRRLHAALREPRYFALLDTLDRLVADPPLTARAGRRATKELPRLVLRSWRRLERAYDEIQAAPDSERDGARHETRKAAKRARYTAEVAGPALGGPATALATRAKRLQKALGSVQDGVIAQERLGRLAADTTAPREAFTLGVLFEVEREEARAARKDVKRVWRKAPGGKALRRLKR